LNSGSAIFNRCFREAGLDVSDPRILAYRWLTEKDIKLHPVANRRTLLFLLGPIFGVLIALMGIVYSTSYQRPWPLAVSLLGTMIASISLWLTVLAYRTNARARQASYEDLSADAYLNR
jgi:protein-S-isoprenylcysteine O-methyltransferase Ste14